MAIKLIEYRVNGSKNKSHKRLTESFGNEDVYIVSLDEVIEGMGGNATDEDINNSLKIFNFIKRQLKTPRLQDLLYVRVSDELAWELEELSQAKNINSFKKFRSTDSTNDNRRLWTHHFCNRKVGWCI